MTIILWVLIVALLLLVSITDLRRGIIPDQFLYPAILLGLILTVFQGTFIISLAVAASTFLAFLLVGMVVPAGMGGGDVKLAGLIGLLVGWPAILWAISLSFLLCAPVCLGLIVSKRGRTVPFGPFLAAGVLVVFL